MSQSIQFLSEVDLTSECLALLCLWLALILQYTGETGGNPFFTASDLPAWGNTKHKTNT